LILAIITRKYLGRFFSYLILVSLFGFSILLFKAKLDIEKPINETSIKYEKNLPKYLRVIIANIKPVIRMTKIKSLLTEMIFPRTKNGINKNNSLKAGILCILGITY
jgi:hypothetical protein